MRGVARRQIDSAGGVIIQGSSTVFVNGTSMVRIGDKIQTHGRARHSNPSMTQGSSTVFCNGIPVSRQNDLASCGHSSSGSNNVFIGG